MPRTTSPSTSASRSRSRSVDSDLATPPVTRRLLPVSVGSGSAASSSAEPPALAPSPGRLRSLARRTLTLPPPISVSQLPAMADVTAASLLGWHAGDLVLRGGLTQSTKRRIASKAPMTLREVLQRIAASPTEDHFEAAVGWAGRQMAKYGAAAVYAAVYGTTVRYARRAVNSMFIKAPAAVKSNWTYLFNVDGYQELRAELAAPAAPEAAEDAEDPSCSGAMLTWQSAVGRADDRVREWSALGISVEGMAQLMQDDVSCRAVFDSFVETLLALIKENGFKHASACMECNPSGQDAVVHFHAYVCTDWTRYRSSDRAIGRLRPAEWAFGGYRPTVHRANIRKNACPKKVMTCGLLYCAVPKVGSVFQWATLLPGKDFQVSFRNLFDLWSQSKLSHEMARKLAVQFRVLGAERLVASVNWIEEKELSYAVSERAAGLREKQEANLCSFKSTPAVVEWQRQYLGASVDRSLRFKPLLLVGASQSGKTRKAISLYGHANSYIVNCQGLGKNLPSLKGFRRSEHFCIIFDEASSEQMLANKLVFQAGVDELTLAQSQCNAHAYKVWLFAVPMILCSNDFQLRSTPQSPMAAEDEEYLAKNLIDGSLPPGELWFCPPPAMEQSGSDAEASDVSD